MAPYGNNPYTRSPFTGRAPRSLAEIGWSATFDPKPGLWLRILKFIAGH